MTEDDRALLERAVAWLAIRQAEWRLRLADAPRGPRHDVCVEQMRTIDEIRDGLLGKGDATAEGRMAAARRLLDDRAEREAGRAPGRIVVVHHSDRRMRLRPAGPDRR